MFFVSSWAPDEDARTLLAERCWLQGVIISAIAYGVTVSLYVLSLHQLVRGIKHAGVAKQLPLLIYITLSFVFGTLFMISLAAFTQMAFIDDRNYPGGPNAFENHMFSIPIDYLGCATFVLSSWLFDGLVVWRFKVIYQSCQVPMWAVLVFPWTLYVNAVLGILWLIQLWTSSPYITHTINFTVPFLGLSLALNILLTSAIVLRLLYFRYRIKSILGPKYRTPYTSIVAMIVESAALYSVMSIAFLVLFALGNAVSRVFLESLNQFQAISTLLILFRVARGKGWTKETAETRLMTGRGWGALELSTIEFAPPGASPKVPSIGDMDKDMGGQSRTQMEA